MNDHVAVTALPPDLFRQTVRMMALLVGACVLFVGVLSVTAVALTSKAVGSSAAKQGTAWPSSEAPRKSLSI